MSHAGQNDGKPLQGFKQERVTQSDRALGRATWLQSEDGVGRVRMARKGKVVGQRAAGAKALGWA